MIKAMITAISQNQNEDRSLGKILYVTHSRYEGDWHSTPHSHACAELFYVISGEGKFFVEGKYLDIHADDLIIVNSYIEHTEVSKENSPLEYIVRTIFSSISKHYCMKWNIKMNTPNT